MTLYFDLVIVIITRDIKEKKKIERDASQCMYEIPLVEFCRAYKMF